MRYVRMLGVCLIAAFAVSALAAGSALAKKQKYESLAVYKNCPLGNAEVEICDYATTSGGPEGGQFTVGPITIPLSQKIALQFGYHENPETGQLTLYGPEDGAPILVAPPLLVPGHPLEEITPEEQEELGWPQSLKESYAVAKKHRLLKTADEQLELVGTPALNPTNIVFEEGVGVEVPLAIKAENGWLATLGDECHVGSASEPIVQHLTSGADTSPLTEETLHGTAGSLEIFDQGAAIVLLGSDLLDNTYPVPAANCTGPFSEVLAATIDKVFGVPAVAGASVTELKGDLHEAAAAFVRKNNEFKKLKKEIH